MTDKPIEHFKNYISSDKSDEYLVKALRHSSLGQQNYERLEFLGDRILSLSIAELLFKKFPNEKEGDLAKRHTALVQGETLAIMARRISLPDFVQMSEAERQAGGVDNDNILADVMEATIAAYYLAHGLERTAQAIETIWGEALVEMIKPPQDTKTALQEWSQSKGLGLPIYEVTGQEGPDHAPAFTVSVSIEGIGSCIGKASSKRQAEKAAAELMLKQIGQGGNDE